jgi:hypothetical protein
MDKLTQDFIDQKHGITEEVETIKMKDTAYRNIELAEIPVPKNPGKDNFIPFPKDITEVLDKDLGRYLAVYQSFASWTRFCISRREIDLKHAKLLLDYVFSQRYTSYKGTATEKKVGVQGDTYYTKCSLEVLEIEADIDELRACLNSYQDYATAMSREMSNRKREHEVFSHNRADTTIPQGEVFGGGE